jgi:hypothetical protein
LAVSHSLRELDIQHLSTRRQFRRPDTQEERAYV